VKLYTESHINRRIEQLWFNLIFGLLNFFRFQFGLLCFKNFNLIPYVYFKFNLVFSVSFVICEWTDTCTPGHLDTYPIKTVEISKLAEMTNLCKR
jgi:hypothetical protein